MTWVDFEFVLAEDEGEGVVAALVTPRNARKRMVAYRVAIVRELTSVKEQEATRRRRE